MLISEPIERINQQLVNLFGIDSMTGRARWRVVWSEEQFEKRLMHYTDQGFQLLVPEVREVPKYRQWIREKHVLERLTVVPDVNALDIPTQKLSYEPIFVFENNKDEELPPRIDVAKHVIDQLYAAATRTNFAPKYMDPDSDPKQAAFNESERLRKMQEELFGNETEVGDALAHKEGVGFTGTPGGTLDRLMNRG